MKDKKYQIEALSGVSSGTEMRWIINEISRLIKVPKKHLRQAFKVLRNQRFIGEIEQQKMVGQTFFYGFRRFSISKKDGTERKILAPHPDVQTIFKAIKHWLEDAALTHKNAYGCVKDRSPKKAAETLLKNRQFPLLSNKHFFRFDIEDAFPSVTSEMVAAVFRSFFIHQRLAEVLAEIITYEYDGRRRLPQGSSCSPIILNLVYKKMCEEIEEICLEHDLNWVVYVDDFHFAGINISEQVKQELLAVPPKYGFSINSKKTRDNLGKTIPHIIGLTLVDGKIHIKRKAKKEFRRIMYAMKFGKYSQEKMNGIAGGAIKQIYGQEEFWPGWLRGPYLKYLEEKVNH